MIDITLVTDITIDFLAASCLSPLLAMLMPQHAALLTFSSLIRRYALPLIIAATFRCC